MMSIALLTATGCGWRSTASPTPARQVIADPIRAAYLPWGSILPQLVDEGDAQQIIKAVKNDGFTTIVLEARDGDGVDRMTITSPTLPQTHQVWTGAKAEGLKIGVYIPLFQASELESSRVLSQRARSDGSGWALESVEPKMRSAASATSQAMELDYISRILEGWAVDYVILGGLGFGDVNADVGPEARAAFERWRGEAVTRWPEDVLGEGRNPAPVGPGGRGNLWDEWQRWRALTLAQFLADLRAQLALSTLPPKVIVVVDAPYAAHQVQGLNWAAPNAPVALEYPWLPQRIGETSALPYVDGVALGLWRPELRTADEATKQGYAAWASVDESLRLANGLILGARERWAVLPREADLRAYGLDGTLLLNYDSSKPTEETTDKP